MKAIRAAAIVALVVVTALPARGGTFGHDETLPPSVPLGFVVTPVGLSPTATSLSFSPAGDALFVTNQIGSVLRYPLLAGLLAGPPSIFLDGLNSPLGVLATEDAVFVSDIAPSAGARTEGRVQRARDTNGDGQADSLQIVISGLPNGRHNTNGLAIGPDGLLYIANGNSTDSGFGSEGGDPEIRPYSGSVLRVDPAATNLVPAPEMVVATGFRNIYDIAFVPGTSRAAVPMNGPDGETYGGVTRPVGEDTLNIFDTGGPVEHFGFPWCLYARDRGGLAGFTQDPAEGSCGSLPATASEGLPAPVAQSKPAALFGRHVSADGLAFNPGTNFPDAYDGDLFVAEFGNFFGNTPRGHKIVRVRFTPSGTVRAVDDFMTGIFPLDLTFAPDGALWVADFTGALLRVQSLL